MKSLLLSTLCFLLLSNTYNYSSDNPSQKKPFYTFPILRKLGVLAPLSQTTPTQKTIPISDEWVESDELTDTKKSNDNLLLLRQKTPSPTNIRITDSPNEHTLAFVTLDNVNLVNQSSTIHPLVATVAKLKVSTSSNSIDSTHSDDSDGSNDSGFNDQDPRTLAFMQYFQSCCCPCVYKKLPDHQQSKQKKLNSDNDNSSNSIQIQKLGEGIKKKVE